MDYPKVILIGGAPLIGKTTVARKVAARLEYGCTSSDDLDQAIIAVTNPKTHSNLHIMEKEDHRQYFITKSAARLADDARKMHETGWPALERVIRNHAGWGTPIVLEGWGLLPEKVANLALDNVLSIWLVGENDVFDQRVQHESKFFDATSMKEVFIEKFIGRSLWYNNFLREEAGRMKMNLIETGCNDQPEQIAARCFAILEMYKEGLPYAKSSR